MMSFSLLAPEEIATDLAKRAKGRRLSLDLTLEGLAKRSGVALERLLLEPEYDSLEDVLGHKNTRKRGRIT